MKSLYFIIISVLVSGSVFAQPVLNQGNLPPFGFTMGVSMGPLVAPGAAGANQSWNFSTFSSDTIGTFTVLDTSSVPYMISYENSNLVHRLILNADTEYTYYDLSGND